MSTSRQIINDTIAGTVARLNEVKIIVYHLRSQRALIEHHASAEVRNLSLTHLDMLLDEFSRAVLLLQNDYDYELQVWESLCNCQMEANL